MPFLNGTHGAVASVVFGEKVVEAVCRDWRTAPVDEKVRATLGVLEKITLSPTPSATPMQTRLAQPA